MAGRGKTKAVARDGKVSLCVLDEQWPFAYLQVYADATVERDRDLVVDVMMAVAGRMSGQPLGEEARPFVEVMAEQEDRVVVRCRPYETFAQPPRHLHRNDQDEQINPLGIGHRPVGHSGPGMSSATSCSSGERPRA